MTEMIIPDEWTQGQSIIKVIGVGGGGCNAVNEMLKQGIKDVQFMICNTDIQSLRISDVPEKIRLGTDLTRGLGAGCDPERGRKAATESIDEIKKALQGNTEMVFITAGMGGGTGTGAAPIIAKVAREMKKLTVGVVTLPFRDEGQEFLRRAIIGIKELQKHVDSLLIIDNQKLYQVFGELTVFKAFPRADEVLCTAVRSISEIITRPGFINVDFADVKMIMQNGGMAIMGIGEAEGPDRAVDAVRKAFESPLLNDCDLTTAKGVLVNITSSEEGGGLTMSELSQIMDHVNSYTGTANKFKRGVVLDPSMGQKISVTVVATGFDVQNLPQISTGDDDDVVILDTPGEYDSTSPYEDFSEKVFKPVKPATVKRVAVKDEVKEVTSEMNVQDSEEDIPATKLSTEEIQENQIRDYKKSENKPDLILEPGEDPTKYEEIPAYERRKIKIEGVKYTRQIED